MPDFKFYLSLFGLLPVKFIAMWNSFRYEDLDIALHYGVMLRECIRHQSITRYMICLRFLKTGYFKLSIESNYL